MATPEHDGVLLRDGAAAEGGPGAAGHDLDAVLVAEAEDRRDFGGRRGQHHRQRHLAIGGQAIRLESTALILGDDKGLPRDEPCQTRDDLPPAQQDILVRLWKCNGHGVSPGER